MSQLLCELLESRRLLSYNSDHGFSDKMDPLLVHQYNDYISYLATSPGGTDVGFVPSVEGIKSDGWRNVVVNIITAHDPSLILPDLESLGASNTASTPDIHSISTLFPISSLIALDRLDEAFSIVAPASINSTSPSSDAIPKDPPVINVIDPFADFWKGPLGKIGIELGTIYENYSEFVSDGSKPVDFRIENPFIWYDPTNQLVPVQAGGENIDQLMKDIQELNATKIARSEHSVSALVPWARKTVPVPVSSSVSSFHIS